MSLINHDGDSLDCGNCFSNVYDANTGIWCHFDDDNITQISDLPKGVYIREINPKKLMSGSTDVLFIVYIITIHLNKYSSFFQEYANMSKINHMKKVIQFLNVFRKPFRDRQEVNDETQTSIYFIR